MPDKKLTDSEIKQAVEKCIIHKKCKNCMFEDESGCSKRLLYLAYNLINRLQAENKSQSIMIKMLKGSIEDYKNSYINQKAEIERLKESLNIELENFATEYDNKIKAEAYKECIEKVKEKSQVEIYCDNQLPEPITTYHIKESVFNNLLKELIGEQKNGTGKK